MFLIKCFNLLWDKIDKMIKVKVLILLINLSVIIKRLKIAHNIIVIISMMVIVDFLINLKTIYQKFKNWIFENKFKIFYEKKIDLKIRWQIKVLLYKNFKMIISYKMDHLKDLIRKLWYLYRIIENWKIWLKSNLIGLNKYHQVLYKMTIILKSIKEFWIK